MPTDKKHLAALFLASIWLIQSERRGRGHRFRDLLDGTPTVEGQRIAADCTDADCALDLACQPAATIAGGGVDALTNLFTKNVPPATATNT